MVQVSTALETIPFFHEYTDMHKKCRELFEGSYWENDWKRIRKKSFKNADRLTFDP